MKKQLVIISDIYGFENKVWLENYEQILKEYFEIKIYDLSKLAELVDKNQNIDSIHEYFIKFGIEKAVNNLLEFEKEETYILGFSMGGSIAWKACQKGLKAKYLLAISSTRLRFETEKPICKFKLLFGEKDFFKPSENWFKKLYIEENIIPNCYHEFYKNEKFVKKICQILITKL